MAKTLYLNLPVADVARATAFHEAIGFVRNPAFSKERTSGMARDDAITQAAIAAGGRDAHEAEDAGEEGGYMYSRAFEDPDGHGWGPFHMDASMTGAGQ